MRLLKCLTAVQEICKRSPTIRSIGTPVLNVPVEQGEEVSKISEPERRQSYPVGILRPVDFETLKADELFLPKLARSKRVRYSSISLRPDKSDSVTGRILDRLKHHLKCDETVFCLFNPGVSKLPMDLLEAGAKRVVILEAEDKHLDKWQRFAGKHQSHVWAHNFNFGRLAEHTAQHFIRKQVFPLTPFFEQCGLQRNDVWKESGVCSPNVTHPPIIFIGVLPPFNERSVFLCLLANRITRQNAFEFGPSEALLFISSSKYVVIGEEQATLPKLTRYRRQEYQLYFDFHLVSKEPLDNFHPVVPLPKKMKYCRAVDQCKLDPHMLHLVHMKPKRNLPLDSTALENVTVDHGLAGLSFLHRQLLACPKATRLGSFLANLVPGVDQYLEREGFDFSTRLEALTMRDIIALHSTILRWPEYTDSCFKQEVDAWLEMMWLFPASRKHPA